MFAGIFMMHRISYVCVGWWGVDVRVRVWGEGGDFVCVCVCDVNALKENACALANTRVVIICTDNLLATFSELSCSKN